MTVRINIVVFDIENLVHNYYYRSHIYMDGMNIDVGLKCGIFDNLDVEIGLKN